VHFGYVITVCEKAEARCPIFPGVGQRLFWPVEDPVAFEGSEEATLETFREARDQLKTHILKWLDDLEFETESGPTIA
jgi:arsenate reductase